MPEAVLRYKRGHTLTIDARGIRPSTHHHFAVVCEHPSTKCTDIYICASIELALRCPVGGEHQRIIRIPGDKIWSTEELWEYIKWADSNGKAIAIN